MRPKISVVYVTARRGGLDILRDNLKKQIFRNFELIVVDALAKERIGEATFFLGEICKPVHYFGEPPKEDGDVWALNKAYNEAFRHCSGELVVSIQDYIWIPADGLQKFWDRYQETKDWVSGVGHKAVLPILNPIDNLRTFESLIKPEGISEMDTRIDGDTSFVETNYSFFELNYAALPLNDVKAIGGMDERYDKGYSCDNVNLALRAFLHGAKFYLDKSNECIGYNQGATFPRPKDWEQRHNKYELHPRIADAIMDGKESYILDYL